MKKVLMLLVVLVAIVAVSALAFGKGKAEMYKGYLADVYCATQASGIAADGANMKTQPEKHTVACLTAAPCAASGYGLEINEGTASAKKYVFYKFDKKGNELAAKLLKNTKKKDNYSVEVKGIKEKDMIKVISIKEITMK
jgi:uncharacterized protein YxeA